MSNWRLRGVGFQLLLAEHLQDAQQIPPVFLQKWKKLEVKSWMEKVLSLEIGSNQQRCLLQAEEAGSNLLRPCTLINPLYHPSTPCQFISQFTPPSWPIPPFPFIPCPILCTAVEEMLLSTQTPHRAGSLSHTSHFLTSPDISCPPIPPTPPLLLPTPPPAPQLRTHHCLCGSHWPGLLGPPSVLTGWVRGRRSGARQA